MKRLLFLTPEDLPLGFALAGLEQQTVSPDRAAEALAELVRDPDLGLLVVDERLLSAVDTEQFRKLQQRWNGVLLVLPAPEGGAALGEDYLQQIIRRALGYHVRIRE